MSSWSPGELLTDNGEQQAKSLVDLLVGRPIDKVFASSLTRTQQTAAPLARARHLTVEILDGLQEVEGGDTEGGEGYLEPITQWADGNLAAAHPGAFDGHHFLNRFDEAIEQVVERTGTHGTAAVVTHNVCIAVWSSVRAHNINPDFAQKHPLRNVEIVELAGDPVSGWRVRSWGGQPVP